MRSTRPVAVALFLAAAVLVGGCGPNQVAAGSGSGHPAVVAAAAGGATPTSTTSAEPTTPAGSVPVELRIPKLGVQSSLVGLGLNPDGSVQVPPVSQPMQAGWYDGGVAPGQNGPAVLLGHVDGDKQAGVFFRLHELGPGDEVLVTRRDGVVLRFTVTRRDEVSKDAFPTQAVYGSTSDPELRLITCGGAFDSAAHSYVDNIVVYATLAANQAG